MQIIAVLIYDGSYTIIYKDLGYLRTIIEENSSRINARNIPAAADQLRNSNRKTINCDYKRKSQNQIMKKEPQYRNILTKHILNNFKNNLTCLSSAW